MKYKEMEKMWEDFNTKNAIAIAATRSLGGRFDSTKDFNTVNIQNGMLSSMLAASIARALSKPSLTIAMLMTKPMIGERIGFYNTFTNPCMDDPFNSKKEKILDVFNSRLKLIKDNKIHILKNRRKI